ncbi:MAG: hypothetical protein RIF41_19665 [Polyangiaceae bacterium]
MTLLETGYVVVGRVAVAVLALATAASAVVVGASAMRLVPIGRISIGNVLLTLGLGDLPLQRRALWILGAVLVVILALLLLRSALRSSGDRGFLLSSRGGVGALGGGSVVVSARSLHALATFTAERVDGVLEASTRIRQSRKGWRVDAWIVLSPRVELRSVAHDVRVAIEESLAGHTGLTVARTRIWAQLDPLSKKRRVY